MWQITPEDKKRLEKATTLLPPGNNARREIDAVIESMMALVQEHPYPGARIAPIADDELRRIYPERYPAEPPPVCRFCGKPIRQALISTTGYFEDCDHIAERK